MVYLDNMNIIEVGEAFNDPLANPDVINYIQARINIDFNYIPNPNGTGRLVQQEVEISNWGDGYVFHAGLVIAYSGATDDYVSFILVRPPWGEIFGCRFYICENNLDDIITQLEDIDFNTMVHDAIDEFFVDEA